MYVCIYVCMNFQFIVMAASHALLNVVYGSDDNKMYCAQQHIHDFFLPPIKTNIKTIVAYNEVRLLLLT